MALLILSFIAGVLTVAAPCVLPLLPVIVGGSLIDNSENKQKLWVRPLIIAASLAVSVVVFTLLLKATTALLGVPQSVWQVISGTIVILLGLYYVWPSLWEQGSSKLGLFTKSNLVLGKAYKKQGLLGAVLIGAALGPVFSSCSPTYALIVATVLPASFIKGFIYLLAYAAGMSATLLLVAYLGQKFVAKLKWLSDPNGWFKKVVGISFILVGVGVILGLDKELQAYILEQGWYDPIGQLEENLR